VRAVGTIAMLLLFGAPTLRTLRRFARRFVFTVVAPAPEARPGIPEAREGNA